MWESILRTLAHRGRSVTTSTLIWVAFLCIISLLCWRLGVASAWRADARPRKVAPELAAVYYDRGTIQVPTSSPPVTLAPLPPQYERTYFYQPNRTSLCLIARISPDELSRLPALLFSLASISYANLRTWIVSGDLTLEQWDTVQDHIALIHHSFARTFIYASHLQWRASQAGLPPAVQNLLLSEELMHALIPLRYSDLLTVDPRCLRRSCFPPAEALPSAPLCDYFLHTTGSHLYNINLVSALVNETKIGTDIIAFDYVSPHFFERGEDWVARRSGGRDSQIFTRFEDGKIHLGAVLLSARLVRASGLRFMDGRLSSLDYRPYANRYPLRLLGHPTCTSAALVHRVLTIVEEE